MNADHRKQRGRTAPNRALSKAKADIVTAVLNNEGIVNCLKYTCKTCRFGGVKCNSKPVVEAVKRYLEAKK